MALLHPFQIMCKPVSGRCNLACEYCYYLDKPDLLYDGDVKPMTLDVLESYTRQYIKCQPFHVEFGWQGGEPTLAGLDFFRAAVEFQNKYKRPTQQVNNALQTNGTTLTPEWCEFLRENNFLVGISLDGPPQWHDHFRLDHKGEGSFHRAWNGVELCREHGVEFNVLITLNSQNAPHAGEIYRYFSNRGIEYVQFIPILERHPDGTPTDFSCTPEQYGDFLCETFELWATRDVGGISERLIDSVLHTMLNGRATLCCYSKRCANAHILEPNGDLYACDHFVFPEWKIGNILETPLRKLVQDPKLDEFAKLKSDLPEACIDCEFVKYCSGGCPKHHRPEIGTDPTRYNHFCSGLKRFFKMAVPVLEQMVPYPQRGQTPPTAAELMNLKPAKAVQQAAATNDEPSRNRPCPCGSGLKYKRCCGKNDDAPK